jgi:hypothetical protein
MTLAQFVAFVKNRHNETSASTSYRSDDEIYALITGRANEILSIIGLIEATDTDSTVVATQAYDLPTNFVNVKALLYEGELLQQVNFREWEQDKAGGTTPSGTPVKYVVWNNQVLLIPVPDAIGTLTFYGEKYHPFIDATLVTTIQVPEELHFRLADGVIGDMAVKDLNMQMATFYENKWNSVHKPEFYRWKSRKKRGGKYAVTGDSDSGVQTDQGVI